MDPLVEKYVYNSTYTFQENKLGLGIELEGLELLERKSSWFKLGHERNFSVSMNNQNIPDVYKNEDGSLKFTPSSVGLSVNGIVPKNEISFRPSKNLPINPEFDMNGSMDAGSFGVGPSANNLRARLGKDLAPIVIFK